MSIFLPPQDNTPLNEEYQNDPVPLRKSELGFISLILVAIVFVGGAGVYLTVGTVSDFMRGARSVLGDAAVASVATVGLLCLAKVLISCAYEAKTVFLRSRSTRTERSHPVVAPGPARSTTQTGVAQRISGTAKSPRSSRGWNQGNPKDTTE